MHTALKFCLTETVKFSLFFSFVFSFVSAEIEVLDYLEFGGKKVLEVFLLAFVAYFPDIFFLSLPFASFRFFSSKRKKFDFLFSFGMSRPRFFFLLFLFLMPVSFISVPILSGGFSADFKSRLISIKGRENKYSFFFEDGKIFFAKKTGIDKATYFIFTPDGDYIGRKEVKNPPEHLFARNISLPFHRAPLRFFLYSVFVALSFSVSGYAGWRWGWFGAAIPLISIFATVLSISLVSS